MENLNRIINLKTNQNEKGIDQASGFDKKRKQTPLSPDGDDDRGGCWSAADGLQ
jgi:hypothetical protein